MQWGRQVVATCGDRDHATRPATRQPPPNYLFKTPCSACFAVALLQCYTVCALACYVLEHTALRAKATTRHRIYVFTVSNHCDRSVVLRLRKLGVKAYAPSTLNDKQNEEYLFPGYVFVWVFDEWAQVRTCKGVIELLRFGEWVPTIRPHIIKAIQATEGPSGYVRWQKFEAGAVARYGAGGGTVKVVRYESHAQRRVRVLMQLLGGRAVEMVVSEQDLIAA